MENKRIEWIDCAKGIAIMLVILGHSLGFEFLPRKMIFSFHMPLFFILSGYIFKLSTNIEEFKKNSKKAFFGLAIPALALYFARITVEIIKHHDLIAWDNYIQLRALILLFANGIETSFQGITLPAFGMMWFLVVLFLGRTIFDFLHLKFSKKIFICILTLLTIIGVYSKNWFFSFDIALAILPFFLFAKYFKKVDIKNKTLKGALLTFLVWAISFFICIKQTDLCLEFSRRNYPIFPLCYICAIAGSICVFYFSQILTSFRKISNFLSFLGKNSLKLFCIHAMDYLYVYIFEEIYYWPFLGFILLFLDIIVLIICLKICELLKRIQNK